MRLLAFAGLRRVTLRKLDSRTDVGAAQVHRRVQGTQRMRERELRVVLHRLLCGVAHARPGVQVGVDAMPIRLGGRLRGAAQRQIEIVLIRRHLWSLLHDGIAA